MEPFSHSSYRGRFAPSPTGKLHMGSLVTALASYLDAKAQAGRWLVRIEDLDPPREIAAASDWILQALDTLGLHWDETVLYQSQRGEAYRAALEHLRAAGLLFACRCSRQDLAHTEGLYPGTCRHLALADDDCALRCRVATYPCEFHDRLQGFHSQDLECDCGDFVVRRKDGPIAYQLAVVVDDAHQGITDVVRGLDLLDSTPRQCYLQQVLQLPALRYAHVPLLVDTHQQKLSKQQQAPAPNLDQPGATLWQALHLLRQQPPLELRSEPPAVLLAWAIRHWQPQVLTGLRYIQDPGAPAP